MGDEHRSERGYETAPAHRHSPSWHLPSLSMIKPSIDRWKERRRERSLTPTWPLLKHSASDPITSPVWMHTRSEKKGKQLRMDTDPYSSNERDEYDLKAKGKGKEKNK